MAVIAKYIVQRISDGQYKTDSGWSSNLSSAKFFEYSPLTIIEDSSFTNGDYLVLRIVQKTT